MLSKRPPSRNRKVKNYPQKPPSAWKSNETSNLSLHLTKNLLKPTWQTRQLINDKNRVNFINFDSNNPSCFLSGATSSKIKEEFSIKYKSDTSVDRSNSPSNTSKVSSSMLLLQPNVSISRVFNVYVTWESISNLNWLEIYYTFIKYVEINHEIIWFEFYGTYLFINPIFFMRNLQMVFIHFHYYATLRKKSYDDALGLVLRSSLWCVNELTVVGFMSFGLRVVFYGHCGLATTFLVYFFFEVLEVFGECLGMDDSRCYVLGDYFWLRSGFSELAPTFPWSTMTFFRPNSDFSSLGANCDFFRLIPTWRCLFHARPDSY